MEKSGEIKRLSPSSIATFLSCPLKFKFQNIDRLEGPTDTPHLIYGTAVHQAIQDLQVSLWTGKLISEKDMVDSFVSSWGLGVEFNEVPIKWYRSTTQNEMTKAGIDTVKNYYKIHRGDPPPLTYRSHEGKEKPAVELRFDIPLDELTGKPDWKLVGLIDLVTHTPAVIDHKTGSAKYSDHKVKTNLQLAIYSYAFRWMCSQGFIAECVAGDKEQYVMFDILSKKKPIIYYHKRVITDRTYKHLAHIIKTIIKHIEAEQFLPNYGETCTAFGGCGFLDHCGEFKF